MTTKPSKSTDAAKAKCDKAIAAAWANLYKARATEG
jgi:hypothetical protein